MASSLSSAKAVASRIPTYIPKTARAETPRISWGSNEQLSRNPQLLIDTMHRKLYPHLYSKEGIPKTELQASKRIDKSWRSRVSPRKQALADKWGEKLVRAYILYDFHVY
jgi:large subunit ribosomal protein L19